MKLGQIHNHIYARLGIALAQPPLIQIMTNTKAPYNISTPAASLALRALSPDGLAVMRRNVSTLIASRKTLIASLSAPTFTDQLGVGSVIGGNNANFVVLPILSGPKGSPDNIRAQKVYKRLAEECGVVVRYRGSEIGCVGCLRITVGTDQENKVLLQKLEESLKNFL